MSAESVPQPLDDSDKKAMTRWLKTLLRNQRAEGLVVFAKPGDEAYRLAEAFIRHIAGDVSQLTYVPSNRVVFLKAFFKYRTPTEKDASIAALEAFIHTMTESSEIRATSDPTRRVSSGEYGGFIPYRYTIYR